MSLFEEKGIYKRLGGYQMDKRVQEYIESQKKLQEKVKQQKKLAFLIKVGLYEKVYAPDDEMDLDEYPKTEWDKENSRNRYYKIVPFEINDDEYEQIRESYNSVESMKTNEEDNSTNSVATFMIVVAILIFLAGLIAGIAFGNTEKIVSGYYSTHTEKEFSFAVASVYWAASFISGSVFIGLAEIIRH